MVLLTITVEAQADWAVATGKINGMPLILRYITSVPQNSTKYPHLIVITWRYKGTANGMPDKTTGEKMVLLEGLLDKKLEPPGSALMTAVVTGNGVKEWQWYSRDEKETMRFLNEALSGQSVFPIQISLDDDPAWQAYHQLAGAAK
jgi:hypothetical protein